MHMRPKDVDEYIKNSPKEAQRKLTELRNAIRETAHMALEKISYGMPYYGYKGRVAYFRLAKKHIGLYIPPPILDEFKDELKDYETAKATVRFPLDEELPIALIKKMIKSRIRINEKAKK